MAGGKAAQVADDLRQKIRTGVYKPDDRLPTVPQLMAEYSTTKATVGAAVRALVNEGLLTVTRGGNPGGTYVRTRHQVRRDLLADIREEYRRALAHEFDAPLYESRTGIDNVEVPCTYEVAGAPPHIAELLEIAEGSPLLVRRYRYFIIKKDGPFPQQWGTSWMPVEIAERCGLRSPADERPGMGTMAHLVVAGLIPDEEADTWIDARPPTAEERQGLKIPDGTSVLEPTRVLYVDGRPVEVAWAVWPCDRTAWKMRIRMRG